jgi:signal transduction histidine kinase
MRVWLLAVAVVAGTVMVLAVPGEPLFLAPDLHLFLETTAGIIACLAAALVYGRFRQRRRRSDLVLAVSLAFVALGHLLFSALATAVLGGDELARMAHASMWTQLAAGLIFLASAAVRDAPVPVRTEHRAVLAAAGAFVAIGIAGVLATPPDATTALSGSVQPVGVVVFAYCAVRFARRAARDADPFLFWLAVSSVLAAGARLNFALVPSLYSDWVGPGDALRLLAHVALVAGGIAEFRRYLSGLAAAAAAQERQRLARELHDGIAQELSFIRRQTARPEVTEAADRAMGEVRTAISLLRDGPALPLSVALTRATRATAARAAVRLDVVVDERVRLPQADAYELVRIACEAVANAARHGGATRVGVTLEGGEGVRLCICDNGTGTPRHARAGHHGLAGMAERAALLGGELRLSAAAGGGTTVEAWLP